MTRRRGCRACAVRLRLAAWICAASLWGVPGLALAFAPGQAGSPDPEAARDAAFRIVAAIERDDWTAARTAAAEALRRHPNDPVVHNLAGVVDAQQGAFDSAEARFTTAIRLAPRAVAPLENLARLYQERSARDTAARAKALDVYRRLLAVDPAHVEGLYQSALLLVLDGNFAEARARLERLPDDVRAKPQALAVLVAAAAGTGDGPLAETTVTALASHAELQAADVVAVLPALARLSDSRAAIQLLEALDARGLATSDLLEALGALYLTAHRYEAARGVLERAAGNPPQVRVLLNLARAAYHLRDHKGALGYLAHARSLDPRNPTVHFLFGMVCVEENLGAEAYESLKKAVELDPANPLINYAMGAVATHRHEPSEAVPYFEKYVALKPDDPRGRFALGAARFYASQFDAARRDLEAAAGSPETATGAHYFLARIARQFNDLEGARREIDESLKREPSYADAWAELGLIQMRQGQHADAEASLQKALSIDPQNYQATVNLAALYSRTRDPRREAQTARVAALLEERAARAQEFLRIVNVVP